MEEKIKCRLQTLIRKILLEELAFNHHLEYNVYTMLQIDEAKKLPIVVEDSVARETVQEELLALKQAELYSVVHAADVHSLKNLGLIPVPSPGIDAETQTQSIETHDVDIQTEPLSEDADKASGNESAAQTSTEDQQDSKLGSKDEKCGSNTSQSKSKPSNRKSGMPVMKRLTVDLVPLDIKEEHEDTDYAPPETVSDDDSDGEDIVVVPELPTPDEGSQKSKKNEEVTCPLCPASFRSQQGAEKHLRVKHDIGNVYICKLCQDICPSNTAMHEHMKTKHGTEPDKPEEPTPKKRGRKPLPRNLKKAKVPPIQKNATTKKPRIKIKPIQPPRPPPKKQRKVPVARSSPRVVGTEKLSCSECSKTYQSSRALRRHVATVHQLSRHVCNICSKEFTSKETLYHHKRGIHSESKPYNCEECGATFNFNHSLRLHRLKHSGKRPHQCTHCEKTYLTSNHLKMHMEGVHGSKKNYSCRYCGKGFSYTTSLRVHEMTHNNIRPYKCSVCGQGFVNSHSLKYHTESKHALNTWFTCDICNKTYKTEFLMKTHRRRHTADGSRYMCDICGRQFMYKSTLEIHAAVHSEEKLYQCSTCGKSFKTYATLYSHQYVHKTESPHTCPDCGKAFKTKERCKAHQKRHSGLKPHECDLCGRCFPDKGGLSKHKRTVHCTEKRFVCNYCGKACSRADNLRVHMKIHDKSGVSQNDLGMTDRKALKSDNRNVGQVEQINAVESLNRMETDLDRITAGVSGYDRLVETVMERTLDKRMGDAKMQGYPHQHGGPPPPSTTPGSDSIITNISSPAGAMSPPLTRIYPDSHVPPYIHTPETDSHIVPMPIPMTSHDSSHMGDHGATSHNTVAQVPPASISLPLPPGSSSQLPQMTTASPYMYMWPYVHHNAPNNSQTHEGNNYY